MKFFLLFIVILFFNGCTKYVHVQTLAPAKIDRAGKTKTIAVVRFENDNVGLASKIETILSSKRVKNEAYFQVISRRDIEKVLREQRFQYSGLIDESTTVNVGNLIGAEAIISGEISEASSKRSYFRETRTECMDKKCKELRYYTVPCKLDKYFISAQVKMLSIESGDIIYADTLQKSANYEHCSDEYGGLPTKASVYDRLSSEIANDFTSMLYPNPINFRVILLDDEDIDYTKKEKELLKYSLEYIEVKRYEKAEILLSRLLQSTQEKSYVALYNLGVIKEIKGDLELANDLYTLADSLTIKPVKAIDSAIVRIKLLIKNKNSLNAQMNAKVGK